MPRPDAAPATDQRDARALTRRLARQQRLLEELLALRTRVASVDELAGRLGVSVRTVERDLESLRASHLPVRSRGGRGGGVWIDVSTQRRPLTLDAEQVMALLLAVDALEADLPAALEGTRQVLRSHLDDPLLF